MDHADVAAIADRLLYAYRTATMLAPMSADAAAFDSPAAYEVLAEIARRRREEGWVAAGRKIGFTNRTIWPLFGVEAPMWADIWDRTVRRAVNGAASLSLRPFVQPRIEPEVVFGLRGPVPISDDPVEVLAAVEWAAPGYEIVQCHFPEWRFTLPDCTASFGLHGVLIVGAPVAVDDHNRERFAAALPRFEATISRDGTMVEQGIGANVLDSPALALAHLARVVRDQARYRPLSAGEIVTTGTITNAWPIAPGETWVSDYGSLGLEGLTVAFDA